MIIVFLYFGKLIIYSNFDTFSHPELAKNKRATQKKKITHLQREINERILMLAPEYIFPINIDCLKCHINKCDNHKNNIAIIRKQISFHVIYCLKQNA